MAVLALEADRARNEDLNERLRRLALITAEATQSFRVEKALDGILRHLVESLNASHGLFFCSTNPPTSRLSDLPRSVGFSEEYLRTICARFRPANPGCAKCFAAHRSPFPGAYRRILACAECLGPEKLVAGILVLVPGKDAPLGLLAIGSRVPRKFDNDEEDFLVNVANLLGPDGAEHRPFRKRRDLPDAVARHL